MDAICVLSWSLYSTLLKKRAKIISIFLIQIMVTVGLLYSTISIRAINRTNVKINKAIPILTM